MEEKTSGIVLGGTAFGENDKILSIFTPDKGVVSAKIRGVKKAGAKMKFASEPFCFAEYVFSVKGNMRTVIGASLLDSFYPLREDLDKYFSAGVTLEYARKFLRDGIVSAELFFLLVNSIKEMAYGEENAKSILVRFLLEALKNTGYGLSLEGCAKCGRALSGRVFFDYNGGGFMCEECNGGEGREINFATYAALKRSAEGEKIESEAAVKPLRLLDFYLSAKIDVNLKSLKELLKMPI